MSRNALLVSKGRDRATGAPSEIPGYLVTIKGFLMADILPFRALRYDLEQVSASEVVTQPYDKITPAMQEGYYAASPYNLVRIILGHREPDNTADNVYTRAAAYGRDWRAKSILRQDAMPSIYVSSQTFTAPSGAKFERRGFIALGRVEDYSAKVVYRHEQTLAKPRPTALTCFAPPAPTMNNFSYFMRIPARSMHCSQSRPLRPSK